MTTGWFSARDKKALTPFSKGINLAHFKDVGSGLFAIGKSIAKPPLVKRLPDLDPRI
jgi:hypothetical protein